MTGKFKTGVRALAVLLTLVTLLGILPMSVFAEEINDYLAARGAAGTQAAAGESEIISEIPSKRDEYTKVFLRADGTQTAVIAGTPLHYEKDGEWEDIDNTLEKKKVDGESVLQNKAGAFTVSLPCDLKENNKVSLENRGYMLSFALESLELMSKTSSIKAQTEAKQAKKAAAAKQGSDAYAAIGLEDKESAVVFESVEKDTDIQYIVTPTGLKENIVLNKKPLSAVSYTYTISADGLTGVLNGDNSIDFKDNSGEVIFTLPAPFMYDTNHEISYDVAVDFSGSGPYTMTYTPSYEWLSDSKRNYPVTVDPAVSVYGSEFIEDTTVTSEFPNDNNGNAPLGFAANIKRIDENNQTVEYELETYFKLCQLSLLKNVKITQAALILNAAGYGTFGVFSIEEPWLEEGVTYNTKPALSPDYLDYIYLEDNEENQEFHPIKLDVTSHYCNWQAGLGNNSAVSDYGVAVKAVGGNDSIFYTVMTEAYAHMKNSRPVYEISFVEANNMDGVIDSHSFNAGRAGTVYLNDFTLKPYIVRNDISIEGNILPVNILFHYNSNNLGIIQNIFYENYFADSYGSGWLTSYNRFLNMTFYEHSIIGYSNEYGDITYFKHDEESSTEELAVYIQINDNNIFPSVGKLYLNNTEGTFYMEMSDGTKEYFDSIGRLIKIEDGSAGKNTVTVDYVTPADYDGEDFRLEAIDKITDTAGREYRFTYNSSGYLSEITVCDKFGDPITVSGVNGEVPLRYTYDYSSTGELIKAAYPDFAQITYSYEGDTEGQLTSAVGIDGYGIYIAYKDNGKVSKVTEKQGSTTGHVVKAFENTAYQNTFDYHYSSSTAALYKKEIKQFDKYGRTVSVRDKDNKFIGVVYKVEEIDGENYSFLDSITDEISALGTSENLLTNGDFASAGTPGAAAWTEQGLSSFDSRISSYNLNCHTPYVYRIKGDTAVEKFISQTVTPQETLEKGDILTLGGWVRANPIAADDEANRFCGLKIIYTYTAEDENGQPSAKTVTEILPFVNTNGMWVFSASEFTLKGNPANNMITVYAEYTNQCNTAYFADIQLTRQEGEEPFEAFDEEQSEPEPEKVKTCPCESCEEYDCQCTCESESVCSCPQCKRHRISEKDANGNIVTSGSFNGSKALQTQHTYTSDGNYLVSSCDAAGNMVQFSYNRGNGVLNSITDGKGNTVSYSYNAMRALTGVSQLVSNLSNGTSISNTYSYENDMLKSITHNGFSYNFTYDIWGNPTAVKVGNQSLVTYAYGSAQNRDRLGKITYGNGDTVTYSYDGENNITGISYNNSASFAYEYAYEDGALISITDNESGYVTTTAGDGIKITKNGVTLFETGYNSEKNYTEASNQTEYTYTYGDGNYDQATGVSTNESAIGIGTNGKKVAFSSNTDWFGRSASNRMTASNGSGSLGSVTHSYTYKETASAATEYVDTFTSITETAQGIKTNTVYAYTYDSNGNIRTITRDGSAQYTYNYDEAGQLTRTDDAVQNKTFTYTYDTGGNIVSKKEYAYTTDTLGTALDTKSYIYDSVWKNKLTSYNGKTISYDAIGNPTSYDGNTFTWNGRILNGISSGSKTLSFKYSENGLRTEKTVTQGGATTTTYSYIWNGDKLVSESDGTNTFYFFYDDSDYAPAGFVLNGADIYFYTKNLQGDITGIADSNGTVITTYTYDAWGKIISVTGTQAEAIGAANPFRYRGYYYDTETDLYYLQSRYYNPDWGRFLNADAYVDTIYYGFGSNMFAYCDNSPISYIDYSGAFEGDFHYNSTYEIAKKYFDRKYAKIIAEYAKKVDSLYPPANIYSVYCQSFHFNTNIGTKKEDSRIIRSEEFFFKAVEYLKEAAKIKKEGLSNSWQTNKFNNAIKNAFKYFGISIHPIQDLYAHSGSKGQKTGYIYVDIYNSRQYISLSKLKTGKNLMQVGVFYHHLNNGDFEADNPEEEYLNTGRTKKFYAELVTEIYLLAFAYYAQQYCKSVLTKY